MPVLALGTAIFHLVDPKIFRKAVLDTIKLGYRRFDTASVYQTEHSLGDAIAESPLSCLINSRLVMNFSSLLSYGAAMLMPIMFYLPFKRL